eukprot:jgi/Mesvir1/28184/Mv04741-RA.1
MAAATSELPLVQTGAPSGVPQTTEAAHPSTSASPASGGAKSMEVCRNYLNGACNLADCKFAHTPPYVKVGDDGRVSICSDYLAGRCNREHLPTPCKFYHPLDHQMSGADLARRSMAGAGAKPSSWDASIASMMMMPGIGTAAPAGMGPPRGGGKGAHMEICRKFSRGDCSLLDCKFAHAGPEVRVTMEPGGRQVVSICLDSLRDACHRDNLPEKCRFYHPLPHQRVAASELIKAADRGATFPPAQPPVWNPWLLGTGHQSPQPDALQALQTLSALFPSSGAVLAQSLASPAAPAGSAGLDQREVCRKFQRGQCSFSDCKFAHVGAPAPLAAAQSLQAMLQPGGALGLGGLGVGPLGMGAQATDHREVCRKFMRGQCTFSDCKFAHPVTTQAAALHSLQAMLQSGGLQLPGGLMGGLVGGAGLPRLPSGGNPEVREVCKKFLRGQCTFADCKFAHPAPSVRLTPEGHVMVCHDFLNGKCDRENLPTPCRYYHPPPHQLPPGSRKRAEQHGGAEAEGPSSKQARRS